MKILKSTEPNFGPNLIVGIGLVEWDTPTEEQEVQEFVIHERANFPPSGNEPEGPTLIDKIRARFERV